MAKRMIIMLLAVATFLAVIGFVKFRQVQAAIAQATSYRPPPEAVTTTVAEQRTWHENLDAIGTVTAVRGVTVSADLPGVVDTIGFDSGERVKAGEVLVRLDTRQEQAQLKAAEARLSLAKVSLDRIAGLRRKGVASQAEYDAAFAEHDQAQAGVGEIQATIDRKIIRAPFTGVLGIREINRGQYLTSGQPVVSLQSLDPIYVDFGVPQQELHHVKVGAEVKVSTDGDPDNTLVGKVTALDAVVDQATRNVQVQATFANPRLMLRPGMFVRADVGLEEADIVVPIPASSIQYAPFGDSVFIVEQMQDPQGASYQGVRQQFIKTGGARGDLVAVVSGIKPGEQIVTSGTFKLRNGAAVEVNNEIQPGSDPSPEPEDN